ncbi:MAG: hypothetical protein WKF60_01125 [Ilumatobacter sp.]
MELILVRHVLPERKEVQEGSADPGLTEEGHQQAEHLAWLKSGSDTGGWSRGPR